MVRIIKRGSQEQLDIGQRKAVQFERGQLSAICSKLLTSHGHTAAALKELFGLLQKFDRRLTALENSNSE